MRLKIKQIKDPKKIDQEVLIKGWVRTIRNQKKFTFIEINDGSTLSNLQVIADQSIPEYETLMPHITTGASVAIRGKVVESPGANQAIEVHATHIELIGASDPETYPLQKKRHSFEFLRSIAHLRPRTNTLGAVTRVRNTLSNSAHNFFQNKGFLNIHTPIITSSDCEGAGQMFQVTTLDKANPPRDELGAIDHSQDFFGKEAYLTVSGQLNGEIYALALSDIYTFGPTFRAENSHTSRHLAEFWMIEPEMAFADLNDDMDLAEEFLKYIFKDVLEKNAEDMDLFNRFVCKGTVERLQSIIDNPFERITYTEAVDILLKCGQKFEFPIHWGCDLQSEHERYLCEQHFKKPIIVSDYPASIKAFYMRSNPDEKTVAAMDVLVPGVGEIIGGSQREERLDILSHKMDLMDLDKNHYWWYLELRKFGSVPHAGFGAGFERLVQFVTGLENIREVIPFPRAPGHAEF
ncbi:MAG: Asparagine--tRNA ligase [Chlamydiales bacterium]|nr:Asparagine--tRNA ligase [Chlamydiales bacterium]